jgi:phosphoribosyl 1,2-cyclic phosphate phosphodiesterase
MINITILGCGCAEGVPVIGCQCRVCKSKDKKDKRTRQSIYLQSDTTKILIDAGPDFRTQALVNKVHGIDGVLVTHSHSDHINGLDDLRALSARDKKSTNLFTEEACLSLLTHRFPYMFTERASKDYINVPTLKGHAITLGVRQRIGDIEFVPFAQQHGSIKSLGFRFNGFAYSTDVKHLDAKARDILKGVPLWMVDCTGFKGCYPAHFNLKEVLEICELIQPEHVVLIHMSHELEYKKVSALLPKNMELAYDGMKISVPY